MENASKALIMAGSMLIALIIISLLVLMFQQLSNIQKQQDSSLTDEQIAQFNKKFELYNTNLYGSEILSLANLIVDYEYREELIEESNKITVTVSFDEKAANQINSTWGKEVFKKDRKYDLVTEIFSDNPNNPNNYEKILKKGNEKDNKVVTFKRIGFRKIKVEYNGPRGRISHLEFRGEGEEV